jgi:hypothetical protein
MFKKFTPKSKFTKEEDQVIIGLVSQFGTNWMGMAKEMKARTANQIRERYLNYLDPKITQGNWTEEEDKKLISFLSLNSKISWKKIMHHFPGRTDVLIKNRSKFLLKRKNILHSSNNFSNGIETHQIFIQEAEIEDMKLVSDDSPKEEFFDLDFFFLFENRNNKEKEFSFLESDYFWF